ncbi:MAG: Rnase Y domain-containing protein, partial [Gemmatimonadales bacterium]
MSATLQILMPCLLAALAGGFLAGWLVRSRAQRGNLNRARSEAGAIVETTRRDAEDQKRRAMVQAREEWLATKTRLEQEIRGRFQEVQQTQRSLEEREAAHRERDQRLQSREQDLDGREKGLENARSETGRERERLRRAADDLNERLSKITGMTLENARQMLLGNLRQEVRFESARMIREAREEAQKRAEMEAGKIVSLAIE